MSCRVLRLVRNQHAIGISPCARRAQCGSKNQQDRFVGISRSHANLRESGYYNAPVNISPRNRNFVVATAIGVISGILCWAFLHRFQLGAADFNWAQQAARALVSGTNPYANTPLGTIPYPLPAAILALPFARFPPELAGGLFFGISSALLAFGLIRQDPQRLLIFLAYPYWAALMTAQWTPLLM